MLRVRGNLCVEDDLPLFKLALRGPGPSRLRILSVRSIAKTCQFVEHHARPRVLGPRGTGQDQKQQAI